MAEKPTVDRRQMLKNAAVQLACKQGYDGTTIKQIASFCGVTVGVIYHYFNGKEELFREALADYMPNYAEMIPQAVKLPVEEGLVKIAQKILDSLRSRAEIITIIAVECTRNPEILSMFIDFKRQVKGFLESYFKAKISAGELAPLDTEIMTSIFFGHFFTAFFQKERLCAPDLPNLDDEWTTRSVKTMIAGWKQGDAR